MRYTLADLRLLRALASLLRHTDPVPDEAVATAAAAGLRLRGQEPRLATRALDLAWLLPT